MLLLFPIFLYKDYINKDKNQIKQLIQNTIINKGFRFVLKYNGIDNLEML